MAKQSKSLSTPGLEAQYYSNTGEASTAHYGTLNAISALLMSQQEESFHVDLGHKADQKMSRLENRRL